MKFSNKFWVASVVVFTFCAIAVFWLLGGEKAAPARDGAASASAGKPVSSIVRHDDGKNARPGDRGGILTGNRPVRPASSGGLARRSDIPATAPLPAAPDQIDEDTSMAALTAFRLQEYAASGKRITPEMARHVPLDTIKNREAILAGRVKPWDLFDENGLTPPTPAPVIDLSLVGPTLGAPPEDIILDNEVPSPDEESD